MMRESVVVMEENEKITKKQKKTPYVGSAPPASAIDSLRSIEVEGEVH